MKKIAVYNPAAGHGKTDPALNNVKNMDEVFRTTAPGSGRRYIHDECKKNPDTHFFVLGGDGTINEAVSGIIDANAGKTALLTAVPCGSGNDTVKSLPQKSNKPIPVDLIKYNDRYSINMLNIGFDCNVVASASKFKNKYKIAGKISYILGVISEFFKPFGENFTIDAICENGEQFHYSGYCMLCAVCNGQWCGGSFHNSPLSDMSDGVLEMLLVKKVSRLDFIKLIGKYKDGTLIDKNTQKVAVPAYKDAVVYHRITKMTITGTKKICGDGEIDDFNSAQISVIPGAIQYLP